MSCVLGQSIYDGSYRVLTKKKTKFRFSNPTSLFSVFQVREYFLVKGTGGIIIHLLIESGIRQLGKDFISIFLSILHTDTTTLIAWLKDNVSVLHQFIQSRLFIFN